MKSICGTIKALWIVMVLGGGLLLLLAHLQDSNYHVWRQISGVKLPECSQRPVEKVSKATGPTQSTHPTPESGPAQHQPEQLLRTQESRHRLLDEMCSKYNPGAAQQKVSKRLVSQVFVEDRHKLLYCSIPKVGCSNWKQMILVLSGKANHTQFDDVHRRGLIPRLSGYNDKGIADRMDSYTKVLFVREPLERLVSAFRDKFENPSKYYHSVFGRAIIRRYRKNATETMLSTGNNVTFKEFIQYLLDPNRPVGMDVHWERFHQLCNPCVIKYDFIGRFENITEESIIVLRRLGAPMNLKYPGSDDRYPHVRTSSTITEKYFSSLSPTVRQKVFDFYYKDYLLFGYPKPSSTLHEA